MYGSASSVRIHQNRRGEPKALSHGAGGGGSTAESRRAHGAVGQRAAGANGAHDEGVGKVRLAEGEGQAAAGRHQRAGETSPVR